MEAPKLTSAKNFLPIGAKVNFLKKMGISSEANK